MSILLGRPIALRDEDCTVHFPKELDDEWYDDELSRFYITNRTFVY